MIKIMCSLLLLLAAGCGSDSTIDTTAVKVDEGLVYVPPYDPQKGFIYTPPPNVQRDGLPIPDRYLKNYSSSGQ